MNQLRAGRESVRAISLSLQVDYHILRMAVAMGLCALILCGCPPGDSKVQLSEVQQTASDDTITVTAGLRAVSSNGENVSLNSTNTEVVVEILDAQGNVQEQPKAAMVFTRRIGDTEVGVDITVATPNGTPYASIPIAVYEVSDAEPSQDTMLTEGMTDAEGRYRGRVWVPADYGAVYVVASALGIENEASVAISNGQAQHAF